jgi:2-oxoglutarate dehydrogenase E2 component (dihydrolipoamide succinyltransferase)
MRIEIKVPNVGESITQVEIGEWLKRPGDTVNKNETLLLLETDKATVEIRAPDSGTLVDVVKNNGEGAAVGEVIARLETKANGAGAAPERRETERPRAAVEAEPRAHEAEVSTPAGGSGAPQPLAPAGAGDGTVEQEAPFAEEASSDHDIDIIGAKEKAAQETHNGEPLEESPERTIPGDHALAPVGDTSVGTGPIPAARRDEAVPMSLLRRRIAERLVAAQQSAALLTTFNEIDMSAVIALRQRQGENFREKHGIKLGFMSFFIKAAVNALQTVREVNAEINGDTIVYHRYYDIGIAVGGGKGLVVPVLRDAERMSFAAIERAIDDFARRAGENKLKPDELQGGTFTITNGGVYGSLLSTPIVNPPQSAILGLHAIQDRPVARQGKLSIKPMMYVALTYDHRIIDGREAVLFLNLIKSLIEEPARLLLES